ncbi:MAG: PAS domain S-box protein [Elusimicrobiota bacterium]
MPVMTNRRQIGYLVLVLAGVTALVAGTAFLTLHAAGAQEHFAWAAQLSAAAAVACVASGAAVYLFLINPMFVRLRENEMKYRRLFDSAADMILLYEPESGLLVDVNPSACRLLGRERRELLGKDFFALVASEKDIAELRRLVGAGGADSTITPLSRKDGSTVDTELRIDPVIIGGRELVLCIGRDLAEQNQHERRALAFYQAFLKSNDFMFYTDQHGVVLDVNDAFVRRFGYTREEAVGRTPRIIRSPRTPESLYKRLWHDILDPAQGFWRGRIVNRTKDGEEVPVLISITAVRNEADDIIGFVSNAVDLADQEELQRRLAQYESLAAVGSMAAVVAHEIRNPLGSIVAAASSISRADLPAEDKNTLLQVIREESKRLNDTLTQFLQYARPREQNLEVGDLNRAIDETLSMVRSAPEALGDVEILLELDKELRAFRFDADQIRQVVWNVLLNAIQAMGGEGTLTISTRVQAGKAVLRVADTGPGIPPEERAKVFQPFHTTKEKGTGLGLAVAERIVSSHGGRIRIEDGPEGGCVIQITLPAEQEGA